MGMTLVSTNKSFTPLTAVPHHEPEIRVSRRGGPELIVLLRQLDATPRSGASPVAPAGHAIVTGVISATAS